MISVLYLSDDANSLHTFKNSFKKNFNVLTSSWDEEARNILDVYDVHVILCEQNISKIRGIDFFESIHQAHPSPIKILITGISDLEAVVDAVERGLVYKYIIKPWHDIDIKVFVERAYEVYNLRKENMELINKLIDANKKLEFHARQSLLS